MLIVYVSLFMLIVVYCPYSLFPSIVKHHCNPDFFLFLLSTLCHKCCQLSLYWNPIIINNMLFNLQLIVIFVRDNLTTFSMEHRFLSWPSTRNYRLSGKIKTHVSSPHAWECYSVCGMSVFSFNELGRNALSPTCLGQGGGHLIAATCWGPSPSGSSSLVWSTSSKQHGSFVTQLYVTMSWSLGASERKKGGSNVGMHLHSSFVSPLLPL